MKLNREQIKKELPNIEEKSLDAMLDVVEKSLSTIELKKPETFENDVIEVLEKAFNSKDTDKNTVISKLFKNMSGGQDEKSLKEKAKSERKYAYHKYLLGGEKKLTEEENKLLSTPTVSKAMSSLSFDTGGIFAHEDMINEILKDYVEYSPVRQLFGVKTTTEKTFTFTRRPAAGKMTAYHTAELESMNEDEKLRYTKGTSPIHKLTAIIQVSREDLMYSRSAVDLEAEINDECVEQLAVAEADDVINGNGVDRAEGILVNTEIEKIATAGSSLDWKDLNKVFTSLKPIYRRNAIWIANRAFINLLMDLEDSAGKPLLFTGGQYPSLQESMLKDGVRGEIVCYLHGKPVYDFPDMPDTFTSGTAMCAFGDFKKGYKIGDNPELYMLRDEYTKSSQGLVKFQFEKYCGGKTVLPEAIKILKLK